MRATFAVPAVLLALVAAPAAAGAATVDPLAPCYRSVSQDAREKVPVHGHGFTPGSTVGVSVDGAQPIQATADQNGDVTGTVTAPFQKSGERAFSIALTETDLPANTVSAQSRIAALSMRLKPSSASPARRVRFVGRGFIDGDGIYGHYLRAGKLRKTVLLGRPQGPCGTIDERHRQIPIRHAQIGRWTLQVDNQAVYSPQPATPFVRLSITVERIVVNASEVPQ
jgi:hypothetical protein